MPSTSTAPAASARRPVRKTAAHPTSTPSVASRTESSKTSSSSDFSSSSARPNATLATSASSKRTTPASSIASSTTSRVRPKASAKPHTIAARNSSTSNTKLVRAPHAMVSGSKPCPRGEAARAEPPAKVQAAASSTSRSIEDVIGDLQLPSRCDDQVVKSLLAHLSTDAAELGLELRSDASRGVHPRTEASSSTSGSAAERFSPRDVYHCKRVVNAVLQSLTDLLTSRWRPRASDNVGPNQTVQPRSRTPSARSTSKAAGGSGSSPAGASITPSADQKAETLASAVRPRHLLILLDCFDIAVRVIRASRAMDAPSGEGKPLQMEVCELTVCKRLLGLDMAPQARAELAGLKCRLLSLLDAEATPVAVEEGSASLCLVPRPKTPLPGALVALLLDFQAQAAGTLLALADDQRIEDLVARVRDSPDGPLAWQRLVRRGGLWPTSTSPQPADVLSAADRASATLERAVTRCLLRLGGAKLHAPTWCLSLRRLSLHLLLFASDTEEAPFWDRAGRVGVCHVRECDEQRKGQGDSGSRTARSAEIQQAFERVHAMNLALVEQHRSRSDGGDDTGEEAVAGLGGFCERWMSMARSAGAADAIDSILAVAARPTTTGTCEERRGFDLAGTNPETSARPPSAAPMSKSRAAQAWREAEASISKACICLDALISDRAETMDPVRIEALSAASKSLQHLRPAVQGNDPADLSKRWRVLDQLRRKALKSLDEARVRERPDSSAAEATVDACEALVLSLVEWMEEALQRRDLGHQGDAKTCVTTSDILYDVVQSLRVLANAKFSASRWETHSPVLELLARCQRAIGMDGDGVSRGDQDHLSLAARAENAHYVSTSYHNYGAHVHRTGRVDWCLPFLREAWRTAARAEEMQVALDATPDQTREVRSAEAIEQAVEGVLKLSEHVGHCARRLKQHDLAVDAFCSFAAVVRPAQWARVVRGLSAHSIANALGPAPSGAAATAGSHGDGSPPFVSRVASCFRQALDLGLFTLLQPVDEQAHVVQRVLASPIPLEVQAALLEHGLATLEEVGHRQGVPEARQQLLDTLEHLYSRERFPIRRARVLLARFEMGVMQPSTSSALSALRESAEKIEECLRSEGAQLGQDALLVHNRPLLDARVQLSRVLLEHRDHGTRDHGQRVVLQAARASSALRHLSSQVEDENDGRNSTKANAGVTPPKSSVAPKTPAARRPAANRATRALRPAVGSKANTPPPVTPKKAPSSMSFTPDATGVKKAKSRSSRCALPGSPAGSAGELEDEVGKMCRVAMLVHEVLESFGHSLAGIRLLRSLRKLVADRVSAWPEARSTFCAASAQLSRYYLDLGRPDRASSVLAPALTSIRTLPAGVPLDVRFRCLLAEAEVLARFRKLDEAMHGYDDAVELVQNLGAPTGLPSWQMGLARSAQYERQALAAEVFGTIRLAQGDLVAAMAARVSSLRLVSKAASILGRLTAPNDDAAGSTSRNNVRKSKTSPPPAAGLAPSSDDDVFGDGMGTVEAAAKAAQDGSSQEMKSQAICVSTGAERQTLPSYRLGGVQIAAAHWRLAKAVQQGYLRLGRLHDACGLGRDAECFATEAVSMATALEMRFSRAQALICRAGIRMRLAKCAEADVDLQQALELLADDYVAEVLELACTRGDALLRRDAFEDALRSYALGEMALKTMSQSLREVETSLASPPRPSGATRSSASPSSLQRGSVAIFEDVRSQLLLRQAWLHELAGKTEQSEGRLREALRIGNSDAETRLVRGRIAMHKALRLISADAVLGMLHDSAISIPLALRGDDGEGAAKRAAGPTTAGSSALDSLEQAHACFEEVLSSPGKASTHAMQVREALIGRAATLLLMAPLGRANDQTASLLCRLIGSGSAVTLQREMLRAIDAKLHPRMSDDTSWLRFALDRVEKSRQRHKGGTRQRRAPAESAKCDDESSGSGSDEDEVALGCQRKSSDTAAKMRKLWSAVQSRQLAAQGSPSEPSNGPELPSHWTVVSITATADRKGLLVSRQGGGRDPTVCLLPIDRQRRREGEEEELSLDAALGELHDIVETSNRATSTAKDLQGADHLEARKAWWTSRRALDLRLKELLVAIEQRWLGPFKSLLLDPIPASRDALEGLHSSFDSIISAACFGTTASNGGVRREHSAELPSVVFDCFAGLSPSCEDEELEDLLHFVMDIYQLNGRPVAVDEVDLDQAVTDLRTALEAFRVRTAQEALPSTQDDPHLFLVLDKDTCAFPWESIPALRGRAVSRVPSHAFLEDRLEFSRAMADAPSARDDLALRGRPDGGVQLGARARVFYLLNPSQDLKRTQERFEPWLETRAKSSGWRGVAGRPPVVDEFADALGACDLVLYFGHSGAEQYARSQRVRQLPKCAVTMLWGCSSAVLKSHGDYDRSGTPFTYMLAGAPAVVGNLWDATDRELDGVCEAVLLKLGLMREEDAAEATTGSSGTHAGAKMKAKSPSPSSSKEAPRAASRGPGEMSLTRAVNESRDACKLPYLTGAAVVTYGVPVYM